MQKEEKKRKLNKDLALYEYVGYYRLYAQNSPDKKP